MTNGIFDATTTAKPTSTTQSRRKIRRRQCLAITNSSLTTLIEGGIEFGRRGRFSAIDGGQHEQKDSSDFSHRRNAPESQPARCSAGHNSLRALADARGAENDRSRRHQEGRRAL